MVAREGNGTPLQYSCLQNPMDGGACWAAVHGVAKSRTRLSDFNLTFHFPALEKEMATHSSVLAWRIPGMGESGGLPSMGSHRVRHDWSDLAAAADGCLVSLQRIALGIRALYCSLPCDLFLPVGQEWFGCKQRLDKCVCFGAFALGTLPFGTVRPQC